MTTQNQDALDAAMDELVRSFYALNQARYPIGTERESRYHAARAAVRKAKMEMGEEGVVEELLYGERIVSVQTLKPGDRVWVTKVEE